MDDAPSQSPAKTQPPLAASPPTSEPPATADAHTLLGPRLNETLQTVLTALILAFVFRAFMVEAFFIPTGSMAEGLLGAHATHVCPRCGLVYDIGPAPRAADGTYYEPPGTLHCPNCGLLTDVSDLDAAPVGKAGDRLLVMKWPYLLGLWERPARWDIVVFRNPQAPDQNFIKRLIGLPGETVELVGGDVFIDGSIARKPPHVQESLWHLVADQSFVPDPRFNPAATPFWLPASDGTPAPAGEPAGWSGLDERRLRYDGLDNRLRTIQFNPHRPIRDTSAYNFGVAHVNVGDVRTRAELVWSGGAGVLYWRLERDDATFRVALSATGRVTIERRLSETGAAYERLAEHVGPALADGRPHVISWAHVDYQVRIEIDDQVIVTGDRDYEPDLEAARHRRFQAPVGLTLSARDAALELRRLRVERDVHYAYRADATLRAYAGAPLELATGEYFVLGDNSNYSHDSREWSTVDPRVEAYYRRRSRQHAGGGPYRLGTVREELIVGQACFVYLPGLLPLDASGHWRVPNVGEVRFPR